MSPLRVPTSKSTLPLANLIKWSATSRGERIGLTSTEEKSGKLLHMDELGLNLPNLPVGCATDRLVFKVLEVPKCLPRSVKSIIDNHNRFLRQLMLSMGEDHVAFTRCVRPRLLRSGGASSSHARRDAWQYGLHMWSYYRIRVTIRPIKAGREQGWSYTPKYTKSMTFVYCIHVEAPCGVCTYCTYNCLSDPMEHRYIVFIRLTIRV